MTAEDFIEELDKKTVQIKEDIQSELQFCSQHNFQLEATALHYKLEVLSDIRGMLLQYKHNNRTV